MEGKKTQQDYDKKWIESNRERKRYLSARSSARSFIRNHAEQEDLEELKKMIEEKENNKSEGN